MKPGNRSKVSRASSRNVTAKPLPAPAWNGLCAAGKHGLDYPGQPCDLCPRPRFLVRPASSGATPRFDFVDDRGSVRWVMSDLTVADMREARDVLQAAIDGALRGAGKEP